MNKSTLGFCVTLIAASAACLAVTESANADESVNKPQITPILKRSLDADPKMEVTMLISEYKPGARTGKHYHPGQEFIYCIEGQGVIEETGKPPLELKPGVAVYFQSDPNKPDYVHEGINTSPSEKMKLLIVLVTEKGRPFAIPVRPAQSVDGH